MGWHPDQLVARENAVGLCGEETNDCHDMFDTLAIKYDTYFEDVMENEGRSFIVTSPEAAPPRILQFPAERRREPSTLYLVGDD